MEPVASLDPRRASRQQRLVASDQQVEQCLAWKPELAYLVYTGLLERAEPVLASGRSAVLEKSRRIAAAHRASSRR